MKWARRERWALSWASEVEGSPLSSWRDFSAAWCHVSDNHTGRAEGVI